jgi:hypothetical protein
MGRVKERGGCSCTCSCVCSCLCLLLCLLLPVSAPVCGILSSKRRRLRRRTWSSSSSWWPGTCPTSSPSGRSARAPPLPGVHGRAGSDTDSSPTRPLPARRCRRHKSTPYLSRFGPSWLWSGSGPACVSAMVRECSAMRGQTCRTAGHAVQCAVRLWRDALSSRSHPRECTACLTSACAAVLLGRHLGGWQAGETPHPPPSLPVCR